MSAFRLNRLRKSIFAKFALSFIIVGLIPLLAVSYFSLNTFGNYMERYSINNFEQMVMNAGNNVDEFYTKYNNISKLMYSYGQQGGVGQLARRIAPGTSKNENEIAAAVDDLLQTVVATDVHIRSAAFVFPDGSYRDMNRNGGIIDFRADFPPPAWRMALLEQPNQLVMIPTHHQDYYLNSGTSVLTFARNLIDVVGSAGLDGKVVGSLYMDISLDAFEDIFERLTVDRHDGMYVVDQNGWILFSNKTDRIGQSFHASESGAFQYVTQDLPNGGWRVIGEVNKDELFRKIDSIKGTITLVVALSIVSLIIVAVWFSNNLSNPIRVIIRHMAKVESGDFNTQVQVRSPDEIGMLARGFNKMTDRLKSYIDEVYVAQIKQKQAELTALKSQIRPHYLYNTLEVIRMSAVANDDEEVADMILALSRQLKYVLDYGEETVSLLDERTNIEQYFKLMELRYGEHRLAMDIRIGGDLLSCALPKLSIQPLVENAIYHGIMPKTSKGTIRISADIEEDKLVITVDDDGVGMDRDKLELLSAKLSGNPIDGTCDDIRSEQHGNGGIGVKNVHDRLVALYGPDYGVHVSSKPNIGTSVRLYLPYRREGSGP
ncbi:two-component system sensor histidine kinase YesM [Paenibacillus phyllosphaerae]|uniref:Two-component system sensor histidine kinase YesM n=1 Tax=Paenibacillus phyllosphaerae TaxID=274593 RepID=A0A7W5B373_9BACL|nr:sensor histidine kinase [Paenibacillus phyllosphaerae]MBB3113086.1 two-component system sensor histidine kinase YesM [Paenibacillus phyllosphaerae]